MALNSVAFEEGRVRQGWRADIGVPELALIIKYVKRPHGTRRLAFDLIALSWSSDDAAELATIVSRLAELAYTRSAKVAPRA